MHVSLPQFSENPYIMHALNFWILMHVNFLHEVNSMAYFKLAQGIMSTMVKIHAPYTCKVKKLKEANIT